MTKNVLFAATALASLAGCTTHLESSLASSAEPKSRAGIAYFLPVTRINAKVTWTVTECSKDTGPVLAEEVVATTSSEPDPAALYVIDYASLNAFTKTSAVKVDFFDSGAIKSINASAEDKTGEIIGHAVSTVSKIVLAAAGAPGGPAVASTKCRASVIDALGKVDSLSGDVDIATRDLANAQATLEALTARLAQAKAGKSAAAASALLTQIDVVARKQEALQKVQDLLAPVMKTLTFSTTASFSANDPNAASSAIEVPEKKWRAWLPELTEDELTSLIEQKTKEERVFLELASVAGWDFASKAGDSFASAAKEREAGIRYRVAMPASLISCKGYPCTPKNKDDPAGKPFGEAMALRVLNRATTFYLPFASKGFSDGALEAKFTESGTLIYAGYDQKKAPGEVLASAVDSAAGDVGGAIKGIRANRTSDLQQIKDETALINAQQELELAQKTRAKSKDSDLADQTTAVDAQTKLIQSQVAQKNAEIALRKAETELAAANAPSSSGGGQ